MEMQVFKRNYKTCIKLAINAAAIPLCFKTINPLFLSFLGGVSMTYPAAFVLIAQGDLPVEQPPLVTAVQGPNKELNNCSVPLTPPTSPEQPSSGNKYARRIFSYVMPEEICYWNMTGFFYIVILSTWK